MQVCFPSIPPITEPHGQHRQVSETREVTTQACHVWMTFRAVLFLGVYTVHGQASVQTVTQFTWLTQRTEQQAGQLLFRFLPLLQVQISLWESICALDREA